MNSTMRMTRSGLLIVGLLLLVITLGLVYLFSRVASNNEPGTVSISNLSVCSKNMHVDIKHDLTKTLYGFVKSANDYSKKDTLPNYSSEIREGSCNPLDDEEVKGSDGKKLQVKTTVAIIDIPEAKQSWKVSYQWVTGKGEINTVVNGATPSCLVEDELKYGDFSCDKVLSLVKYGTDKYDPILQYTPYHGQGFYLSYNPDTRAVKAEIRVPEKDINNTELIENNKYAVSYWFNHRKLEISNYNVTYEVIPL